LQVLQDGDVGMLMDIVIGVNPLLMFNVGQDLNNT
jgi:hypothetical protein